jgi:hypothetical protein
MQVNLLSLSAMHVLGDVFAHHQEHLTVFTASGNIHCSSKFANAVNITRCCKYGQVPLTTGENIARNM